MAQANPVAALGNIYKTPELWDKIKYTALVLLVSSASARTSRCRASTRRCCWSSSTSRRAGLLGLYDLFVGGSLSRATVFALGIMPYISSSIFMQIAGAVVPQVEKLQKDEEGRKKVTQWSRYLTVALAMVQGYGFSLFLESGVMTGAVMSPGIRVAPADDAVLHRRRGVRDVARRADHGARPRQRRVADHLLLHRRALLERDLRHAEARRPSRRSTPFGLLVALVP